jgi:hypothetical protein
MPWRATAAGLRGGSAWPRKRTIPLALGPLVCVPRKADGIDCDVIQVANRFGDRIARSRRPHENLRWFSNSRATAEKDRVSEDRKLGGALIYDAALRVAKCEDMTAWGIYLDAENEKLAAHYQEKCRFKATLSDSLVLYAPLRTLLSV